MTSSVFLSRATSPLSSSLRAAPSVSGVPHTDILGHLELECDWVGYCPLVCASPYPCQSSHWFSRFTVSVDGTLLHHQGLFVAEQAWFYTQGTFRETKLHRQIMTSRSEIAGSKLILEKCCLDFFISEEMKASDKLHHLAYGFREWWRHYPLLSHEVVCARKSVVLCLLLGPNVRFDF